MKKPKLKQELGDEALKKKILDYLRKHPRARRKTLATVMINMKGIDMRRLQEANERLRLFNKALCELMGAGEIQFLNFKMLRIKLVSPG